MICANCGKRPGTIRWGAELSLSHGWVQMWCERCAVEAQIKHAEERAAALPELRTRLGELDG